MSNEFPTWLWCAVLCRMDDGCFIRSAAVCFVVAAAAEVGEKLWLEAAVSAASEAVAAGSPPATAEERPLPLPPPPSPGYPLPPTTSAW